ncbi:hypothetical protein [Burkholderia ubonensis]|uniref:hypothetical protein n=1 Tax=Burkholderia ubonensis TaxID=101571 RepID=UPI001E4822FC|nr:hypothetical protein [Burkholderia ubonensis]
MRLNVSGSKPDAPLHGDEMNTQCGCSLPAATRTSAGVASRHPDGGSRSQYAVYCPRVNRSIRVHSTPTSERKSRHAAGSLSMPPMQRHFAVMFPTRDSARWKPLAPPPKPLHIVKTL